jgi:predicted permease
MRFERWLYTVPLRLRSLFKRRRVDEELDEELRDHVERTAQALVARGFSPSDAHLAALKGMNGLAQRRDECRDARRVRVVEDLLQDLGYAVRVLGRSRGFTAVAVLSLGLGIGANTVIFSVIDALLLRELPVKQPGELVTFRWDDGSSGPATSFLEFAYPAFAEFSKSPTVFSSVAGSWIIGRSNIRIGGPAEAVDAAPVAVALVSGNYFDTLGVRAALGRAITVDDDRSPGAHPVIVISDRYWEQRLARTPDVVGRTLTLAETTYTILGVAPPAFSGEWVGTPADLWIPYAMASQVMPEVPGGPRRFPVRMTARLRPGVRLRQAEAAAEVAYRGVEQSLAGPNATIQRLARIGGTRLLLIPAARGLPSPQRDSYTQPLAIVMAVAGLVLLVACANVANLLLARAAVRKREMAVRLAIGASRGRIMRQLLTEHMLLALAGGALGLLLARWSTTALVRMLASGPVSMAAQSSGVLLDAHLDSRSLTFAVGLSVATGLLFGLTPAARAARASLSPALNDRAWPAAGSARFGTGKTLVVVQVALSMLLLACAGLFIRTLSNLRAENLGFDGSRVLLIWAVTGQTGRQAGAMADLWRTVQERLSVLPGVVSASAINGGVLTGSLPRVVGRAYEHLHIEGQPPSRPSPVQGSRMFVAPRFFETMGIPLVAGREFGERDGVSPPRVAIINESMARFHFGKRNPVGARVRFAGNESETTEIVGVVRDYVKGTPRAVGLQEFTTYFPYRDREALNVGAQTRLRVMMAVVRTAGDPLEVVPRIRREFLAIDSGLPVLRINTVAQQLDEVLAQDRLLSTLSSFFGLLGALLACLGLYGVMAYIVARRTTEIGVRVALGATRGGVLGLILRESLSLVAIGLAIGVLAAVGATQLISARLFGVSPADPLTISGAALALMVVASVSAFVPAHHASRIAPIRALRCE